MTAPIQVIKVGGSLLDMPDLPGRITSLIDQSGHARTAMIIGGGPAADLVRQWDQHHHVGETAGHWLAVQAMQLNMHLVASVLDRCRIVKTTEQRTSAWQDGDIAMIDPVAWVADHDDAIPRRWTFTSDSIAAHMAWVLGAANLLLAKSTIPPGECNVANAAQMGIVDSDFEQASSNVPRIELINLRVKPLTRCVVRSSV